MEFDKLVKEILSEGIGDPDAERAAVASGNRATADRMASLNPQSSHGNYYNRSVQRANRNSGLKQDPLGVIMVLWKGAEEPKPLRNPETKQVLTYRYSKSIQKVKSLEDSGRYERVYWQQTELD